MESMRNQGGIQMLLTAEHEAQNIISAARNKHEAQNIVSAARNMKLSRLKQAKEEAEKEAAAYRSRLETEFKNKVSQTSGDSGSTVKMLDQQTETKIKSLKESASKVEPEIIKMLINYVSAIKY